MSLMVDLLPTLNEGDERVTLGEAVQRGEQLLEREIARDAEQDKGIARSCRHDGFS